MLKRAGSGIVIGISIIVVIIALGTMSAPWIVRGRVFGAVDNIVNTVNTSLQFAQNIVTKTNSLLEDSQSKINAIQNSTLTISDITQDKAKIQAIKQTVSTDLANARDKLSIYADDLKGFATNIDNTVEALSRTTLLQQSTILNEANNVLDKIQAMGTNLANYSNTIDQILNNPTSFGQTPIAELLQAPLSAIDNLIASAQTALETIQQKIVSIQGQINDFVNKFKFWVTTASVVFTLVMLWVIFSQVMLIRHFWPIARHGGNKLIQGSNTA